MREPHDVTVQLDRPGRELTTSGGGDVPVADSPVFVDASGRRGRKYRRIGWLIAFACASYAVLLVFAVFGGDSAAPWLLIPGPATGKKADTVRIPAGPVASPAPGQRVPGATPAPVPVNAVSTGAPKPATAVSHGVRAVPAAPGARSAPSGKAAGSGTSRKPAPPVRVPGGGSTVPAPVVSAPPSGGGRTPAPSAPAPSGSATAPPGPGQSATDPGSPHPQRAHRKQ
ncbi:hypothetical protein [Streptomyces sp. NPDC088348]|uniref:hypothetical protein n=1 Tax=Streptomyces sp. NPDC088348 TaxID=3365853 RepID=UPI00381EA9F1